MSSEMFCCYAYKKVYFFLRHLIPTRETMCPVDDETESYSNNELQNEQNTNESNQTIETETDKEEATQNYDTNVNTYVTRSGRNVVKPVRYTKQYEKFTLSIIREEECYIYVIYVHHLSH